MAWAWGLEWVWVGGYSAAATTILLTNCMLLVSVIRNRYLHYTFNYVVFALSLRCPHTCLTSPDLTPRVLRRNILRVVFTLGLVVVAKLSQAGPAALQVQYQVPSPGAPSPPPPQLPGLPANLSRHEAAPRVCEVTAAVDSALVTSAMFYLALLALHLFCRAPNPPSLSANLRTLKLYGLECGVVPIQVRLPLPSLLLSSPPAQEAWWLAPLVVVVPPLLAASLALPAALLQLPHPLAAIPGGELCTVTLGAEQESRLLTFHTSEAILGYCLPLALAACLVAGLSVRRCVSCCSTSCVSSFCKEELVCSLLALLTAAAQLPSYLPTLATNLERAGLGAGAGLVLATPTLARLVEMLGGGALPVLVFTLLPAYSKWSSQPDTDDLRSGYR